MQQTNIPRLISLSKLIIGLRINLIGHGEERL